MAPYFQLVAQKKCVATVSAEEGLWTQKTNKNLNCHHFTILIIIKLKHETSDIKRKGGWGWERATTLGEDR